MLALTVIVTKANLFTCILISISFFGSFLLIHLLSWNKVKLVPWPCTSLVSPQVPFCAVGSSFCDIRASVFSPLLIPPPVICPLIQNSQFYLLQNQRFLSLLLFVCFTDQQFSNQWNSHVNMSDLSHSLGGGDETWYQWGTQTHSSFIRSFLFIEAPALAYTLPSRNMSCVPPLSFCLRCFLCQKCFFPLGGMSCHSGSLVGLHIFFLYLSTFHLLQCNITFQYGFSPSSKEWVSKQALWLTNLCIFEHFA